MLANHGVEVRRVRRRLARAASRTALGLVVAPVIAMLLYGAGTHLFGQSETLIEWILIGWMASWFVAAPLALAASLAASVRTRLRIDTATVKDGELRLVGQGE